MKEVSAQKLAEYIFSRCTELGKPVSHITMQKMMYIANGVYAAKTCYQLIDDYFYAWKVGPTVKELYYEYMLYLSEPIRKETMNPDFLTEVEKRVVDATINALIDLYPWELAQLTNRRNGAWDLVYNRGKGEKRVIKPHMIETYFRLIIPRCSILTKIWRDSFEESPTTDLLIRVAKDEAHKMSKNDYSMPKEMAMGILNLIEKYE